MCNIITYIFNFPNKYNNIYILLSCYSLKYDVINKKMYLEKLFL